MLSRFRRRAAPVALVVYATFLCSLFPRTASADDAKATSSAAPVASSASDSVQAAGPVVTGDGSASAPDPGASGVALPQGPLNVEAIPKNPDKSGVSSQAITVPQGSGKIQGFGESFSAQLSTGIATYSVPLSLLAARGGAQPSLGLSYSSSLGHGLAGVGWELGVPFIARQTDRGVPGYDDPVTGGPWHPRMDRFVFNGGQELVPICLVGVDRSCAGALSGEVMPVWAANHLYFRARVEGSFLRFFWSPDHQTWRVQDKRGLVMELGVPLDDPSYQDGIERDPTNPSHVFRWNLVRQYDAQGDANPASGAPHPSNVVSYRWSVVEGMGYLTEIFDTPPQANVLAPLSDWAHHTRLTYELRTDPTTSFRRGWRTAQTLRITRVDVTSKTFGATGARELVRRYHFGYDSAYHPSLLQTVQMEGRCAQPVVEGSGQGLPYPTSCPRLPAMKLGYRHVDGFDTGGNPSAPLIPGFEAFDARVRSITSSPQESIDDSSTDFFDVNSDGLPDVVVTAPGLYQGKHGLYLNGTGGTADAFSLTLMGVQSPIGDTPSTLSWSNLNVAALDLDGDGIANFLHMPQVKTYAVYSPQLVQGAWQWTGRSVTTANQLAPKIDFGKDGQELRVVDVNGDGLVDVLRYAGTEYQTYYALGKYPGGDGLFGNATMTGAKTAFVSTEPIAKCVPWSGLPLKLSDPDVKLGDMNGDGLVDLVRVRKGDLRYWPGRGNGVFGTGGDCPSSTTGVDRSVVMGSAPNTINVLGADSLRLDDVNGDGLDDLVQVLTTDVYVWLNVDGASFSSAALLSGTPNAPAYAQRVRLVDVNGSGTRDVLWGDGLKYRYMDLSGGARPWVLTHVENGLGKTTDLEYGTTTAQMLAAEKAGQPWATKMPMVAHVVTKITEKDNLAIAGRPNGIYVTTYEYRDPVYEGRQREFRGFTSAKVTRVGDANGPTAITESRFLLGECKDETNDFVDDCALSERWRDDPREALKGLPIFSEVRDANGVTISTSHHTYRLRELYQGLDGRAVRYAYESASDAYTYDTAPYLPSPQQVTLPEVELEKTLGTVTTDASGSITVRTGQRAHVTSIAEVDAFGNGTAKIARGCVDGCGAPDEVITQTTVPGRRNDDPTGWMWRTVESYVTGSSAPLAKRSRTLTTYDLHGNPTLVQAELAGSLALDRFHETNQAIAPPPPGASVDGIIELGLTEYDAFGNVTKTTAPNARCRTIGYDEPFAQLALTETVYAGTPVNGCGSTLLTASAAYDRGFALVTQVQDLHNEITLVEYDGFARLSALTKPDPAQTSTPSARPSVKVEYFLTQNPTQQPYSVIHTQTQDGASPADDSYRNAYAYVDGMGRPIVSIDQADPTKGDLGAWVVNGLTDYDAKGETQRVYLAWFWDGNPMQFPLATAPATSFSRQRYDAFGRAVERFGLDGQTVLKTAFHALSEDGYDAADLGTGTHMNTPATVQKDGHGRTIASFERVHNGQTMEVRATRMTYLPTGEPVSITRERGADTVVRWMRYDTLGRMVLNVDPHTTVGFNADPSTAANAMKAWRYAYNDDGDIVGTSDARGCGENFAYDAAGRLLTEDYSPCLASHAAYMSAPEVTNRYDFADPDQPPNFAIDTALLRGRLVSVSDRAQKTLTRFDGRGRVTGIARRVAAPGTPGTYAPRWYTQTATFDGADRPVDQTTGAQVAELLGASQQSFVRTTYTKRGTLDQVAGSYGTLVAQVLHDADGLPTHVEYGDLAQTSTDFTHDVRRRLKTVQTYRGPPVEWSSPPVSYVPTPNPSGPDQVFQSILEDGEFFYDEVDNPTEIRDYRNPAVWPAGAKPVTRKAEYDDLYRLTKLTYQYATGDDGWTSPNAAEYAGTQDPRHGKPSPEVSFDKRVLEQTYGYDWLGNLTQSGDDAKGFYDRSLGTQSHNGTRPYQLTSATGAVSTRDGSLTIAYDAAGDMTSMALVRNGPCLPTGAVCSARFAYEWDELGRMVRARRWDTATPGVASDPLPSGTPDVELRHAYDASDQRVVKTAVDASAYERHTVYVFGSLELRGAVFESGDYADTKATEVVYLFAHGVRVARLHYSEDSLPTLTSGKLHVLLELPDHLGSSSIVIDKETGELAERTTYLAYGGTESDYRPDRWGSFREDYKFTGKEEDEEVGLQYFGKRFFAPGLGRWISPDPLAVHAPGEADLNLYAYVHGGVLRAIDPVGLEDKPGSADAGAPAANGGSTEVGGAPVEDSGPHIRLNELTIVGTVPAKAAPSSAPTGVAPTGGGASAPQTTFNDFFDDAPSPRVVAGLGFGYGLLKGLAPGGASAPSPRPKDPMFLHWEGGGQIVGGLILTAVGTTAEGEGTALCATAILCVGGAPLVTVGVVLSLAGAVNVGAGVKTSIGAATMAATGGSSGSSGATGGGGGGSGGRGLEPEPGYLRGKKHGINQQPADAIKMARDNKVPIGVWGDKADLAYAGEKASTLKPGEMADFPIRPGSKSTVYYGDGSTSVPDMIRVSNNGDGTFHGFPIDSKTAGPIVP